MNNHLIRSNIKNNPVLNIGLFFITQVCITVLIHLIFKHKPKNKIK